MQRLHAKNVNNKRWPTYWWTSEIAELRKNCLRRFATRRRKKIPGEILQEESKYEEAKKYLKISIKKSKKERWEELRNDVNNNPWGLGYKVVMKKLRNSLNKIDLNAKELTTVVNALFLTHQIRAQDPSLNIPEESIPLFSPEELTKAATSLQNKKDPGPDRIPSEILKLVCKICPEMLLNLYNKCIVEGIFPRRWKTQRLILISKNKGDPKLPSAYRPLCMLDTSGKLLEKLVKTRLTQSVENTAGLAPRQYGFRKGLSTISAVNEVVKKFNSEQLRNRYSRNIVLLVTLDVKKRLQFSKVDRYFKISQK